MGRAKRLMRSREIVRVLERGDRASNAYSNLYVLPQGRGLKVSRFTVIVKKGVAPSSVHRNRARRCFREGYRKSQGILSLPTADRVLVIRDRLLFRSSSQSWVCDLEYLLQKNTSPKK
jgi:ribonuclease P protein component